MKEVSCRALDVFFCKARKQGIPVEALTAGVPRSLEELTDKHERIEWAHFVRFMANVGRIWTPEEQVELGVEFFSSPAMKPFSLVAKVLFSPTGFYKWIFGNDAMSGKDVFSCVEPRFTQINETRLLLELSIKPGFAPCPEFFVVSKGNFTAMPRLLGLPLARVEMELTGSHARYLVTLPRERGWFRKIRRWILLPLHARSAVTELQEVQAALELRHGDLDTARSGLDRHTRELEVLDLIGRALASHTSMDSLSDAIVQLIRDRFDFSSAALWVASDDGFKLLKHDGPEFPTTPQTYSLTHAATVVGRLEVWAPPTQEPDTTTGPEKRLPLSIESILPWIALALENLRSKPPLTPAEPMIARGGLGHSRRPGAPVIDHYDLLKLIGRGAYGEVWLARNVVGIYRAVKVLYRSKFEVMAPYDREFKAVERFMPVSHSHPGFVTVFHIGREASAEFFYYVMDIGDDIARGQDIDPETYAPRSLSDDVLRNGRLPVDACLELGILLGDALERLHRQKLVHRDIKPSNIIFVNGAPCFADIGLVTHMAGDAREISRVGTPDYIAPEGPGSAVAEVYSLGKLLYVAGMGMKVGSFPELPSAVMAPGENTGLSKLNDIILRATATDPRERFQSAAELAEALRVLRKELRTREQAR